MQRSTLRALVCAFVLACLPPVLVGQRGAPAAVPQVSPLAVPVRTATGPDGAPVRPATPPPGTRRPAGTHHRPGRPTNRITSTVPITAFPARGRTITLTFDDGPDLRWTPTVLDLLRQYHAHAIFCVVGLHVAAYPDLVRRMVREGHALCDHTWTHDERLPQRPAALIEYEIGNTAAVLTRLTGSPPRYYRAPAGNWSAKVIAVAAAHGLAPLGWAVDPADWARPGTETIIERVLAGARPGAVVLMHDGYGQRAQSVAALRVILAQLARQGYRFTIPA